jgi:UDP-glucose 4-epimerase
VDRLVEADNEVVIVDDFSFGREENIAHHRGSRQVRIEKADICDAEHMTRLAQGMDIVFHLAVFCLRNSLHDPSRSHEVNATGSLRMCQAALENGIEKFVYVSSAEVYGTGLYFPIGEDHPFFPTNVYGAAKAAGELYARSYWKTYGLPIVIVRLFNTYGPREHSEGRRAEVIPRFVMRTLAGQRPLIFGTGQQTRDFTYVDDIVRGIIMAAECDEAVGDCMNLARGQDVSVATICGLVLKKLDRLDLEPLYLQEGRPADIDRMHADVSKAKRLLGFSADVSIEEGLDRYIEWVQQQTLDLESWWSQERTRNW